LQRVVTHFSCTVQDIVAKTHERSNLILHTFKSRDIDLLVHAYLVYVRPIVQYNLDVWSPYTIKDTEAIECVQS